MARASQPGREGYSDKEPDRIAKLPMLLQMDMEGTVNISQKEPYSEIIIYQLGVDDTKIKDQQGNTYAFDWKDLVLLVLLT
jgi:hypothetical protein